MTGFLYILQSESSGRYYVGSTDNVSRRVNEHHRGKSLATRGRGPWKLVYQESLDSLAGARRREYQIKQWKSASRIRELLVYRLERAV